MSTTSSGRKGEYLADIFLREKGFNIIDRNFRCRTGEIDVICRNDSAIRFIEVKYRQTPEFGLPQESVVKRKQERIRKTALLWLKHNHLPVDSEIHFDVLAIRKTVRGKLIYEFFEDAF